MPEEEIQLQTYKDFESLTTEQVNDKRQKDGYNEIPDPKKSVILMFAKKFYGLTPFMLELTIIVSVLPMIQKYQVAGIVGALLVLNAIIGLSQELNAQKAIDQLKQKLAIISRVVRDGKIVNLPARELVTDDILIVKHGEFVSADVVIKTGEIEVDQSALTGESALLRKRAGDELYSGSIVHKGEAICQVKNIGVNTYFGKTINLVKTSAPKSHMDILISKITGVLMLTVIVTLVIAAIIQGIKSPSELGQLVPLLLLLLTSAVPVALPTMFLVSSALATVQLSKKGVIISRLHVTEDAAGMKVLCTDKTGTLTKNEMSVSQVISLNGMKIETVADYGYLASRADLQDHIDLAFVNHLSAKWDELSDLYEQTNFVPFDFKNRRTEATVLDKKTKQKFRVTKGAVNTIVKLCKNMTDDEIKQADDIVTALAKKGHKSVGVAYSSTLDGELVFAGVVGISDPPRNDTADVIKKLQDLGIQVKMLTGDSKIIAQDIGRTVGIGSRIFSLDKKDGESILKNFNLEDIDGFAEIFPEDKHAIVKAIQEMNVGTVGFTGDGVNDSAGLKLAEVGIAVSNAVDVAKSAASVVMTQGGLSGVIDLVRVGRQTHQKIETWILNKIIKTFQMVIFVVIAFFVTGYFIISPAQLVILLFLVDFVTVALSTDKRKAVDYPLQWDVIKLSYVSIVVAAFCVLESFGLLYIGIARTGETSISATNLDFIQTYIFELLFFFGMGTLLVVRERSFWFSSHPSWQLITAILIDSIIMVILSGINFPGIAPIPMLDTLIIILYSLGCNFIVNDAIKVLMFRLLKL